MNHRMEIQMHSRPEGIYGDAAFVSRPGKLEGVLERLWKA